MCDSNLRESWSNDVRNQQIFPVSDYRVKLVCLWRHLQVGQHNYFFRLKILVEKKLAAGLFEEMHGSVRYADENCTSGR